MGETDTGRTVRLYVKRHGHRALLDVEGVPFETSEGYFIFATLDGQPVTVDRITTHGNAAALIITPDGPVGATADGTDPSEAREALKSLTHKAPIGGWTITCVGEEVDDGGRHRFVLRVHNELVSAQIVVELSPAVAASWTGDRGRSLEDVVRDEESRRIRSWSLTQIEDKGSRYIHAGYPLA